MTPERGITMLRLLILAMGLCALVGCNLARATETISITPDIPRSTGAGWQTIAPGLEERWMDIERDDGRLARAILLRIDPAWVTFRVHYTAGGAYSISAWGARLPDALGIVNGSFFDQHDRALGLLVSDGQIYGQSFEGFGGMFQVEASGRVRVRSLVSQPYAEETLIQAVQAFPVLVEAGGIRAPQDGGFDRRARRSFVAQDNAGHIILGVIPYTLLSLAELQTWLLTSDLAVQLAVGLDGGRSTGMVINAPGSVETYASLDKVPTVIAVYPR